MPEQKPRYMQQLDEWTAREIIEPVREAYGEYHRTEGHVSDEEREDTLDKQLAVVEKAIREKVLQSYRNEQKAGPPRAQRFQNKQEK